MTDMDSSKKRTLGILISASIGLAACGVRLYYELRPQPAVVYRQSSTDNTNTSIIENRPTETIESSASSGVSVPEIDSAAAESMPEPIPIYLCGSVKEPGVYFVKRDTFLFELIDLAGGLTSEAASEHINMVMVLDSPVSVYIPSIAELNINDSIQGLNITKSPEFIRDELNDYVWGNYMTDEPSQSECEEKNRKININTANEEELTKLSGIGEVTAAAIIRYRSDYGTFEKIEDIMKVPGIKQGRFDAIKDMIEV